MTRRALHHAELAGRGDHGLRRRQARDLEPQPFVAQLLVRAFLREPLERERRLRGEHVERDEREQRRDRDERAPPT